MKPRLTYLATAPFCAARRVHDCYGGRLHGHNFLVQVQSAVPPTFAAYAGQEAEALAERLSEVLALLDGGLLNDHMNAPSDASLAKWVQQRLALPEAAEVQVHSTPSRGAGVSAAGKSYCWQRFRFEAAHRLPHVPLQHPCGRMHGHGFMVVLWVQSTQSAALQHAWQPLHAQLHLACLNEIPGLENPTSERLAAWLWTRLQGTVPQLHKVTVYETASAGCHYDGQHYTIWKEETFESALLLETAPPHAAQQQLHGHSYVLRLYLSAALDQALGWTVDYSELQAQFAPLRQQLDHHLLNELPGLSAPSLSALLLWLREGLSVALPSLCQLELEHTPGCGAALCWDGAQ